MATKTKSAPAMKKPVAKKPCCDVVKAVEEENPVDVLFDVAVQCACAYLTSPRWQESSDAPNTPLAITAAKVGVGTAINIQKYLTQAAERIKQDDPGNSLL